MCVLLVLWHNSVFALFYYACFWFFTVSVYTVYFVSRTIVVLSFVRSFASLSMFTWAVRMYGNCTVNTNFYNQVMDLLNSVAIAENRWQMVKLNESKQQSMKTRQHLIKFSVLSTSLGTVKQLINVRIIWNSIFSVLFRICMNTKWNGFWMTQYNAIWISIFVWFNQSERKEHYVNDNFNISVLLLLVEIWDTHAKLN